jgi:hypothetical protein
MAVPVTDLTVTGRHQIGSSGSIRAYCIAQSKVSFLRS